MFVGKNEIKDIFFATGSNKKRVKEIYIGTQRVYNSNYSRNLSYEYDNKTQTYIVAGRGICNDSHIIIPSFVNAGYGYKKVVAIKEQAFYKNTSIIALTLGSNIEIIGNKAFQYCSKLKKINFNTNLKRIETSAFEHCTGLQGNLALPDGLEYIGTWALADCRLSKLFIPSSVTTTGYTLATNNMANFKFYCEADEQPSGWANNSLTWAKSHWEQDHYDLYDIVWGADRDTFDEIEDSV